MNAQIRSIPAAENDTLVIAGKTYRSRLLTGTGKFKDLEETRRATEAAGAEIVTVAIRRTNIGQDKHQPNLLDVLPPDRYTILPNTAGCYTADDAVRTCKLARELLEPRLGSTHQAQFVDAGGPRFRHRAAVETQAVDVLDVVRGRPLLGRSQVERLPAQRTLLTQDGRSAEGVAAVQRNGVIEDVEDAHG